MKQKLLFFFLTAFLSLIGGGELWATDSKTFTDLNKPTVGSTEVTGNVTVTYGNETSEYTGKTFTYNETEYFGLQAHKTESSDLSNNIPLADSDNFYFKFSTYYPGSMEVFFYNADSKNERGLRCYKKSDSTGEVTAVLGSSTIGSQTLGSVTFEMEPGYAYYVYDTNTGNIYYTGFTFTPDTKESAVEYPHTWNFNYGENNWPSTVGAALTSKAKWTLAGVRYKYNGTTTTDGGDYLYDGNDNYVEETRGLKFSATTSTNISTDLHYDVMLSNGASVIIPNVKTGNRIVINGWWPSGGTVTATNAKTAESATSFTGTAAGAEYTFYAIADGDVKFTVGTGENYDIWSIAVLKTDINFGSLGGSSKTTGLVTDDDWTYIFTFRNPSNASDIMSMSTEEWENVTFSLPNTDVISFTKGVLNTTNYCGSLTIHPVAAGSVVMNVSFPGSDRYNAKEETITFTITKQTQTLTFAAPTKIVDFGQAAPTNTLTQTPAEGGGTVSYSSSDDHVATVDAGGALDIKNSGTCTITATAAETSNYLSATASYTLTVNGSTTPTITMQKGGTTVSEGATVETTYDNSIIVTGVSSEGLTVKYRSENTSIATVDASGKIVTKNGGTVKIYVYTEGSGNINPVETYYNLVINASSFSMTFVPNSGTINIGKTITPYVTLPSVYAEDVTEITASSNNTGIATVVTKIWDKNNPSYDYLVVKEENGKHKIERIKPTITGIAKGTTTISLTLSSSQYITSTPAIYTITVADDSNLHFDWASKDELTMYEGDYMMMPAITGNANGYPFVQNDEQRYVWAMTQDNTHVTSLNWYNTNYHPGEGEPFYWLTDNGGGGDDDKLAYILYAQSSEARTGTHPEGLMIYARKAGTVKIHAKDMQLDKELSSTITLTILPKANIYGNTENGDASDGQLTVEQKSITYPYTWDFTKNFSTTDLDANSYYWTKSGSTYSNGLALQNSDYGDDNHDGTNAGSQRLYKAILANGNTIPAFKGMTVQLQGTYFNSKYDKITLKPTAGDGNSHLHVNGGPQYFQLPAPATSGTDPEEYRVYVKAKPTQPDRGEIRLIAGGNNSYWFENAKGQFNDDGIYWAPVVRGQDIKVAFQDVDVYWIAVSTEKKAVNKPDINENLTYAASSYAYNKALDLSKSEEANKGLEVYYASGFNKGYGASASAGSAVVLTRMTTDSKPVVEANTGLILKAANALDSYMIAHAENAESPVTPSVFTGEGAATNYLVAGPGARVNSSVGTGNDIKTNFVISHAYRQFTENTSSAVSGYLYDRNWSFYKIIPYVDVPSSSAYLSIPGNLYVNEDGEIVERATSARAAFGAESAADDDTAEAPASKLMLDIIFQETSDTATDDPATEDPESPLPPDVINGIDNVKTDEADKAVWHSMEGVRISQPTKPGLYIRNGKKVVIK